MSTAAPVAEPRNDLGPAVFKQLQDRLRRAGLLEKRTGYYVAKIELTWLMYAAGWVGVALASQLWQYLLGAGWLGFWAVQVGLIGHDVGHRHLTGNRRLIDLLGLLHGNFALGMSYGWWVRHHNRHHAEVNDLEQDPDITRRKAIFDVEQASDRSGFSRWVARNQGWVYFPMKLLEAVGLRLASFRTLRDGDVDRPTLEGVVLVAHFVLFLSAAFLLMPFWHAVLFVIVQQMTFGLYLGMVFATNHKGMPVRRDDEMGWLERQVVTSRNLRSNLLVDFLYGGLNYQIEHHLFPTMPRPNLRHAAPIVRQFCRERDLPYHETGVGESYVEVARHLADTARTADWQAA